MGNSRLDASVSIKFSQKFACQVSWQNIDETGAAVEEDITEGGDTGGENGGGDSGSGGNGNSGNDNPPGELEG